MKEPVKVVCQPMEGEAVSRWREAEGPSGDGGEPEEWGPQPLVWEPVGAGRLEQDGRRVV